MENHHHSEDPALIFPNLYYGSKDIAKEKSLLDSLNIKAIINVTKYISCYFPSDYSYKQLKIRDDCTFDISKKFQECFTFIDFFLSRGNGVLVHCDAGISRSATIIIGYYIYYNKEKLHKKLSVEEAFNYVKSKRSVCNPNSGFMRCLIDYFSSLQSEAEFYLDFAANNVYRTAQFYGVTLEKVKKYFLKHKLDYRDAMRDLMKHEYNTKKKKKKKFF